MRILESGSRIDIPSIDAGFMIDPSFEIIDHDFDLHRNLGEDSIRIVEKRLSYLSVVHVCFDGKIHSLIQLVAQLHLKKDRLLI